MSTRESASRPAWPESWERYEVIEALSDMILLRGVPKNIRSDNAPEFISEELRKWLAKVGTGTLYIEPGSP